MHEYSVNLFPPHYRADMFPSFVSLSDRERQRRRLLEKTQQRLRNEAAMREAFADTIWATDNNTVPSLTKASTAESSVGQSSGSTALSSKSPASVSVQDVSMETAPSLGSKKSSVVSMGSDTGFKDYMISELRKLVDNMERGELEKSPDVSMESASSNYGTPKSSDGRARLKAPSEDSANSKLEQKAPVAVAKTDYRGSERTPGTFDAYPKGWSPAQPVVSEPLNETERSYLNQLTSLLKSKGAPKYITMVSGTGDTTKAARLYSSGMATTSSLRAKTLSYAYT